MELLLSLCLGIGLAAACGFRVFIPFLVMSVAARAGHLGLDSGFGWLTSDAALITLAVAAGLEVAAYFVPWLDNLLDTAATPTAVVAGVLATAAVITDASPLVTWTLAVIGGGGVAGAVQGTTAVLRGTSSVMTGGLGNPVIAAGEAGSSFVLSTAAIVIPVLTALVAASLVLSLAVRRIRRQQRAIPLEERIGTPMR